MKRDDAQRWRTMLRHGGEVGLSRRQFLTMAAIGLGGAACTPGAYRMPTASGRSGDDALAMRQGTYWERDVSAQLPEGLEGRYYFGGGYMGREGLEPQSVLVELDANRGVLRRSAYTYNIREGAPLTNVAGAKAEELLEVVRRIAGRIHKIVPVPERDELYLFPVSGAPAVVDAKTLQLKSSFGERFFFADNFCAHPHYDAPSGSMVYTRMDVLGNLDASLGGQPEHYMHQLMQRDLKTGKERVILDGIKGAIVHEVGVSPDGSLAVIVFTGDGIRAPFGRAGNAEQIAHKGKVTAEHSRIAVIDWAEKRIIADFKTAAVPVHLAFEAPGASGRSEHVFIQCVNSTFVDDPPGWYGTGAYQKISLRDGKPVEVARFDQPKLCNVPHSMRLTDQGDMLVSTNAESRLILALEPGSLDVVGALPFAPIPSRSHDYAPRGLEQSTDGRFLVVSSNTSLHFFDLQKRAWAGKPIGVTIGQRHAHTSRSI